MSSVDQDHISQRDKWIRLHRKQLPIILGIASLCLIPSLVIGVFNPDHIMEIGMGQWVLFTDLIVLPLMAINSVFWSKTVLKLPNLSSWKAIAGKVLIAVIAVVLTSMLLESIYASLGYEDDDFLVLGGYQASASMTNVIDYGLMTMVISLPIFIWQVRIDRLSLRLNEKEIERERLMQLKAKAELHALQSRINPHFLFNSFNSIASLISVDPDGAEKMIVQLSELFRYSLNSQESNFVTIEEELKIVDIYLKIEKVRFGENLDFQIKSSPTILGNEIPRFLIQPLVENAVKHATSKVKQGEILLDIEEEGDKIVIRLYDNGPPFPNPLPLGYGIQSTYDKLELLYPNRHSVKLISEPTKHVYIELQKGVPNE